MSETGISELARILPPERVTNDPTELTVYGYDGTWLERRPDVAVSVVSSEEVAGVLRWANRHEIPVVPRGAGSGSRRWFGADIRRHSAEHDADDTQIKSIDRRTMRAVVQPGVVNARPPSRSRAGRAVLPSRSGQPAPIDNRRKRRDRGKRASVSQVRRYPRVRGWLGGGYTHR